MSKDRDSWADEAELVEDTVGDRIPWSDLDEDADIDQESDESEDEQNSEEQTE